MVHEALEIRITAAGLIQILSCFARSGPSVIFARDNIASGFILDTPLFVSSSHLCCWGFGGCGAGFSVDKMVKSGYFGISEILRHGCAARPVGGGPKPWRITKMKMRARPFRKPYSVIALVAFWVAAVISWWRVLDQGVTHANLIPAVCFTAAGIIWLLVARLGRDTGTDDVE
jgi:hypothetical protein